MLTKDEFLNYVKTLDIKLVGRKKEYKYINLFCAFDIETTSIYIKDDKFAFVYAWCFGINKHCTVGRNLLEYFELLEQINNVLNVTKENRLLIYCHNLKYEFQFIRDYHIWNEEEYNDIFALNSRTVVKALTENGNEYRCSYILSGYKLETVADNLVNSNIKKLVGDLNYSLVRHHKTKLTNSEIQYIVNDVKIVIAYLKEKSNGDVSKLLLTKTSYVRKVMKKNMLYTKAIVKGKNKTIRNRVNISLINHLTLSEDEYKDIKYAFMGGYTHASIFNANKIIENVKSMDMASAYPHAMLTDYFPMSKGVRIDNVNIEELEKYCNDYCVIINVSFTNIKLKKLHETPLSISKCYRIKNVLNDNGRVRSADSLSTICTEIDYNIYKEYYVWDSLDVNYIYYYVRGYLPKEFMFTILDFYEKKTKLKGVKGMEIEYMGGKENLNSLYGMLVTDIIKDLHKYDQESKEWYVSEVDFTERLEYYNTDKNRCLSYIWGVYTTAHTRKRLFQMIDLVADDYIYSDTDSVKFTNYEKYAKEINIINDNILNDLNKMTNHYNIDYNLIKPINIKGESKPIGIWECDGEYKRFKTLGAKRYLFEDYKDNIEMVVSGLPKKVITELRKKMNNDEIFTFFNNEMHIKKEISHKNTHVYIDEEKTYYVTDYLGNNQLVTSPSSIFLEKADYNMYLGSDYLELLLRGGLYV